MNLAVRGGISITSDDLGPALKQAEGKMYAALAATMEMNKSKVQSAARQNAPWTDQTSNARNGLFADTYQDGTSRGIVLYHTMEYGPWLELRWSGRYATINPTVRQMGPLVLASVREVLRRVSVSL